MSDNPTDTVDDELLTDTLRSLVSSIEEQVSDVAVPELRSFRRQKARRLATRVSAGVLSTAAVVIVVIFAGMSGPSTPPATVIPASRPVLAVSPSINLDVISAQTQVSINLASGSIQTSPIFVSPAASDADVAIAFPRSGYVFGFDGEGYVAVSDNLQRVLHRWSPTQGQYPAPASNPADVWLSQPYARSSTAQEFNEYGQSVGPTETIPQGSIVDGQVGGNLVLQSEPPAQTLELWDPSNQQVVAILGSWDQLSISASSLAWTSGNTLRIANSDGVVLQSLNAPVGYWTTALSFSPDGSNIAVVWAPRPGSPNTNSRASIDASTHIVVVNVATGRIVLISGGTGAVGPITWTANGARIFFGQSSTSSTSVGLSTFAIGSDRSTRLDIPEVRLPADFGPSIGSLFVWNS